MIALVLATLAHADGPPCARVPEARREALGLGVPTAIEGSPELRYPLTGGGYVRVLVLADPTAADAAFAGLLRTAATAWPAEGAARVGDRSVGDGTTLLVRARNAVLLVRDPSGRAEAEAGAILAAMTTADRPTDP